MCSPFLSLESPCHFSSILNDILSKEHQISRNDTPSIRYPYECPMLLNEIELETEYCLLLKTEIKNYSLINVEKDVNDSMVDCSLNNFNNIIRNIHLSVDITHLPSLNVCKQINHTHHDFEESLINELNIREKVKHQKATDLFYKLCQLVNQLTPTPVSSLEVEQLRYQCYSLALNSISFHITQQNVAIKKPPLWEFVQTLQSNHDSNNSLNECIFNLIVLSQQLLFFDEKALRVRLNHPHIQLGNPNRLHDLIYLHDIPIPNLMPTRNDYVNIEKTEQWFGTLGQEQHKVPNHNIELNQLTDTTNALSTDKALVEQDRNQLIKEDDSLEWLYNICSIMDCPGFDPLNLMACIMDILILYNPLLNSATGQQALIDLLGMSYLDTISDIGTRQHLILNEFQIKSNHLSQDKRITRLDDSQKMTPTLGCQIMIKSKSDQTKEKKNRKLLKKSQNIGNSNKHLLNEEQQDSTIDMLKKLRIGEKQIEFVPEDNASKKTLRQQFLSDFGKPETKIKYGFGTSLLLDEMGLRRTLPKGTTHTIDQHVETFHLPATEKYSYSENDLLHISVLPLWAQRAFPAVTYFNYIQSKVLPSAFGTGDNLLISAPTGSGKTNVALLAMMQQIGENLLQNEQIKSSTLFKMVYIAPMKSLVGEIVTKLTTVLSPLGLKVSELTADIQLTRKELNHIHIIVTVPEKWDILTRNTNSGGISLDQSLLTSLSAIIIDEIHLLNDERGPVLESIIARTLRYMEAAQKRIRLIGLSATLPNWEDIGLFLRVAPKHIFHFNDSYRPIPLELTLKGIQGKNLDKKMNELNQVCYDSMMAAVKLGYLVMIFVHSRGDTRVTADALIKIAYEKNEDHLLLNEAETTDSHIKSLVCRSRDQTIRRLFDYGFGVHHAGMRRTDRNLSELLFSQGAIKVLVCTATLAWGVNLPAQCVIIKGTNIFDSKKGGFKDIGILDVLQIFGRAGRPQFDATGHAILLTTHQKLPLYLRLLTHQIPIESQFLNHLTNALNAEIAMGNISDEMEGVLWLAYTYLYIRMFKSPQSYNISYNQLLIDPELTEYRRFLIAKAASFLEDGRLIRINRLDGSYYSTEMGRIAAKYYVDCETAREFHLNLNKFVGLSDLQILELLGNAQEYESLQVRPEEISELSLLARQVHIIPKNGIDSIPGKVVVLIQAFLYRLSLDTASLVSDSYYIQQNAPRLMRCLLDMSLSQSFSGTGTSASASRIIEWCKMLERRISDKQHILRHFCYGNVFTNTEHKGNSYSTDRPTGILKEWGVMILEKKQLQFWRLLDMNLNELIGIIKVPNEAKLIYQSLKRIPNIYIDLRLQPITNSIIRLHLKLKSTFEWNDRFNGTVEPFRIWVEDPSTQQVIYTEDWMLKKKALHEPSIITFVIPLETENDSANQYILRVVSDRWVGVSFQEEFSIKHLILPNREHIHTPLLDLYPLPVTALQNPELERLYPFQYFNPIQTQIFHSLYHTPFNVLLGAPTGSGKTVAAELAIFHLFREYPKAIAIYIAPMKALAKERLLDWKQRIEHLYGKRVTELTGDHTPDIEALRLSSVIITTPEKWDGISRMWKQRDYVCRVGLVIIDEIHLLGMDRGPTLEVIVSRMRYISTVTDNTIRFVGLSTALSNSHDIADWLGIGQIGLFNFKPSVRPVPCVTHISAFPEKHYCPRMASMNKPAYQAIQNYSPDRPVLIFVASRRQTRITALDIIGLSATNETCPKQFLHIVNEHELLEILSSVEDPILKRTLEFGVGMHHAGLQEKDRNICETLFRSGTIQILITTATLAWGVNLPAHLVIIKGTEVYDGKKGGYVDMPITDVLQMMGRAGRPQYDTSAVACVFVYSPKKDFYKKFIYEPFPVESCLAEHIDDHLNAEICTGTIGTRYEALDYMTWTYLFRRLTANPSYYHAVVGTDPTDDTGFFFSGYRTTDKQIDMSRTHREKIASFIEELIDRSIRHLCESGCIITRVPNKMNREMIDHIEETSYGPIEHTMQIKKNILLEFIPTQLGKIAAYYYVSTKTVTLFHKEIKHKFQLSWIELLLLLCDSTEYKELPVRHNEDTINAVLSESCPIAINMAQTQSPATKAFLLLQCHLFNILLPNTDYITDLKSVLDQSIRLVQALVDICVMESLFVSALNCCVLLQSLTQGSHVYRNPLFLLPHLNDTTLKKFPKLNNSFFSLPHLLEMDFKLQKELLESILSPKFASDILRVLQILPKLRIQIYCHTRANDNDLWTECIQDKSTQIYSVPLNSQLRIVIILRYANHPNEIAYTPKFSKKKTFGWWCFVGDYQTNQLFGFKRIASQQSTNNGTIRKKDRYTTANRFNSKAIFILKPYIDSSTDAAINTFQSGTTNCHFRQLKEKTCYNISVVVCSDSYMGLDQEIHLKIQIS